jgi:antitoxin component of MazEF toxin-antitoxin module
MQIKKTTKVQQSGNIPQTSIPRIICDIMGIKKGDTLNWIIENENEAKIIRKE